ncbi:MAG: type II toxin-antitoxin system VapC family toxin [Desulfosarcina sp.]
MVYADTSVLVTLYLKETYSRKASDWIRANNEAIPKTIFHQLEFTNAIQLKQFRKEMSDRQAEIVLNRFKEHEREGIFYPPQMNWSDVFNLSLALSDNHTKGIGSRCLDIIHVASALCMDADRFFTFDARQSRLASAAGMRIVA